MNDSMGKSKMNISSKDYKKEADIRKRE